MKKLLLALAIVWVGAAGAAGDFPVCRAYLGGESVAFGPDASGDHSVAAGGGFKITISRYSSGNLDLFNVELDRATGEPVLSSVFSLSQVRLENLKVYNNPEFLVARYYNNDNTDEIPILCK